jgi:hypothetical protein
MYFIKAGQSNEKGGLVMIEIPSKLEGRQFDLYTLEQKLKPIGYSIGGGWDYDGGSLDYKIKEDEEEYLFLRLPFFTRDGQLDDPHCTVSLGRPFLLSHVFQGQLDDNANIGNFSASINQFSEPEDPDATFPEIYIDNGKRLVAELESVLLEEE